MAETTKITIRMILTALTIAGIIGGAIWATAGKGHTITDNETAIGKIEPRVTSLENSQSQRDIANAEVRKDVQYMRQDLAKQQVDIDNNTVLLERILVEVTK